MDDNQEERFTWDDSPHLKFKLEQDGSSRHKFKLTTNDPYWMHKMQEFQIPEQWRVGNSRIYMLARGNVKFRKKRAPTPEEQAKQAARDARIRREREGGWTHEQAQHDSDC